APATNTNALYSPYNGLEHHILQSYGAVTGVTGYEYSYSWNNSTWTVGSSTTTLTSVNWNLGDQPNQIFYTRVRAFQCASPLYSGYTTSTAIYSACDEPVAPTVTSLTLSSVSVSLNTETPVANPAITTYAIYCSITGQYVQASGALGASAVWQTKATWGTIAVTGLTCATSYTFYAIAKNGSGDQRYNASNTGSATTSACEMKVPATGNNSYTVCAGHIYDNGGSAAAYAASSTGYTVIYPGTPGNMIQLTGSYYTEAGYDSVVVYNGGISGTKLFVGSTSALTTIPTLVSTDASGALTIRFKSDGGVQNSGFDFTIACIAPCSGTPTAGSTQSTATTVCSSTGFTLSMSNPSTGPGITYQWEISIDGTLYSSIVGATSATYTTTQSASSYYHCLVSCTNSGLSSYSSPIHITNNLWTDCYCTSSATSQSDEEIYSVTVNGATNAYGCTTIAPGTGSALNEYSNFTTIGSLTTITQGNTIAFTIEENECDGATYYSNGAAIFIDYNHDGDFTDAGEQVYTESGKTISPRTITGTFVVPMTSNLGTTRMRIIVAEDLYGATLLSCGNYTFGETEDYLVNISGPCTAPGSPTAVTATVTGEETATISWTPGSPAGTPTVSYYVSVYEGDNSVVIPNTNLTGTTALLSGLDCGTTYYYKVYASSTCGAISTIITSSTFFTHETVSSIPYTQDFESSPNCWVQKYMRGTSDITLTYSSINPTTTPQSGSAFLSFPSYLYIRGDSTRMISSAISTSGASEVKLSFWWYNENNPSYNDINYQKEGVSLYYTKDKISWNYLQFFPRHDASMASGSAGWKLKSIILPADAGNSKIYLGFTFISALGDNCSLDNLWFGKVGTDLPVSLVSFTGNCETIDWSTTTETNNNFFTLERSINGIDWVFVEKTPGAGNSNQQIFYSLPSLGEGYYKLTQTDFDGNSETFPPIFVSCKNSSIKVFPNPVENILHIQSETQIMDIEILNTIGKIILTSDRQDIDVSGLITGLYTIKIVLIDGEVSFHKIIKQ
ncbi:MAG: GEVED domain-containing protein, partial [bacterium]